MPSESVMVLSPENRRKALIRISQFVLRDEIQKTRDELQENIVEMALFWGTMEEGVPFHQINGILRTELYFIEFPDFVLTEILERLLNKKRMELQKGKYILKESRRSEISKAVKENELVVNEINDLVILETERKYKKELSKKQKNAVLTNFYSYLASLFIERAEVITKILIAETLDFSTDLPKQIFANTLEKIGEEKLRKAYKDAFSSIIDNPTENFLKFLFSISQNLICIQVLNLDPECRKLERDAFSEKVLFLDTNIAIDLVCESRPLHKVANDLIEITSSLGSKFVVSERTIEEYLDVLEDANKSPKNRSALRLLRDPFISSYNLEKKTSPSQTWKGYYYRMKKIESILHKKFNIAVYKEKHDEMKENPSFDEIAKQVTYCYEKIRYRPKKVKVAEHDAFHLLLIRELRKDETPTFLGPRHWFITGDATLLCVDDAINRKLDYTNKTPSSMMSNVWLEMISPFLSSDARKKSLPLFGLLLRREFVIIPFKIKPEELVLIQGDWLQYDWLEDSEIEEILKEKWVRDYIDKVKIAEIKGEKEKIEDLASLFAKKLTKELEKIKDEKIKLFMEERNEVIRTLDKKDRYEIPELKRAMKKQELTIKEQEMTLKQQRQKLVILETEYKKKWRTVTGILGTTLVIVSLFLIILMVIDIFQITLNSVSLVLGCFGIGSILLLMTISYKQVKGKLP